MRRDGGAAERGVVVLHHGDPSGGGGSVIRIQQAGIGNQRETRSELAGRDQQGTFFHQTGKEATIAGVIGIGRIAGQAVERLHGGIPCGDRTAVVEALEDIPVVGGEHIRLQHINGGRGGREIVGPDVPVIDEAGEFELLADGVVAEAFLQRGRKVVEDKLALADARLAAGGL